MSKSLIHPMYGYKSSESKAEWDQKQRDHTATNEHYTCFHNRSGLIIAKHLRVMTTASGSTLLPGQKQLQ